jgi:NAD(P)H dehydrogenase (quinone)
MPLASAPKARLKKKHNHNHRRSQQKHAMKVLVVYHTVYGHVLQLARAVEEGVKSVSGIEAVFRRAPEFPHTEKELEGDDGHASKIWQAQKNTPACTLDDLREADGLLLGSPTRYGNMTAQMKALIDSTASLWLSGAMEGKPAGVFTSTASTHGGQETTCVTMMIPLLHLGMLIVGVPYSTEGMIHT